MKVVALVSGGKDSCYAMMKCMEYGHEIVALANLLPTDDAVDELDSYMYQTVGHQIVAGYAECMGVPLFRKRIQGTTRHQSLSYKMTPGDEVEDMLILLSEIKRQIPSITAVSSGAIASDYQRLRVESICSRLGLVSLAYLWKQDQALLLHEMITNRIVAITVKVAAMGLDPAKHLGKEMAYLEPYLHKLKDLYGINVCGEGGEYETMTLDCPLFLNARIVLDEFRVVLHSSDAIAPVGVLHPLAFHLEHKTDSIGSNKPNGVCCNETAVHQVQDDYLPDGEAQFEAVDVRSNLCAVSEYELKFSKSKEGDTFSICCWLNSCKTSTGLQDDLNALLTNIEIELQSYGLGWEDVLYIHLYIDDINQFSMANDTYVRYITQDKCRFGVPSRSTIELPLSQVGVGRAYLEVLVARDQSKRVLHVQSISCWAPSCIGPYSQTNLDVTLNASIRFLTVARANLAAFTLNFEGVRMRDYLYEIPNLRDNLAIIVTIFLLLQMVENIMEIVKSVIQHPDDGLPINQATLYKGVLFMAGQLGLDPPTMSLCNGGSAAELELALQNCDAVAQSFGCSISTSTILIVIYCSKYIPSSQRHQIQNKLDMILNEMKSRHLHNRNMSKVLDPIFIYVLVPDLPKRALVEVKPILHVPDDEETIETTITTAQIPCRPVKYWGFQHERWHESCIQQSNTAGKLLAAVLYISKKLIPLIFTEAGAPEEIIEDLPVHLKEEHMERIVQFCIFLIDTILHDNGFYWDDAKNVRIYFSTSLCISLESLSLIFNGSFHELAVMNKITLERDPIFNLVPVLGAGNSAIAMDDIFTCEVFAQKS